MKKKEKKMKAEKRITNKEKKDRESEGKKGKK